MGYNDKCDAVAAAAADLQMYDVTHAHTGGARNSLVMRVVGLSDDVRAVRGRAVHMAVTWLVVVVDRQAVWRHQTRVDAL